MVALVMEQVDMEYIDYKMSDNQRKAYLDIGGAPHLDNDYTVFGKVIDGLEVIDQLAVVKTGNADKPVEDLFLSMEVEELSKKKITKLYGYEYPTEK